ncbi:MAG: 16S rRNA (uracil(1498)-N(3))-methyltransferase [Acidimicrobiia bacterium]
MSAADRPGPLVFVEDLDRPVLSDADRHHLDRVLRLRRGDPLVVADGMGGWRPATFGERIEPTGPPARDPEPEPPLTVCFALVKGERPELVVQKLTELGVDRIVPFAARRSVVRWDGDRAARQVERLAAVARAAAMQSHRARLPVVAPVAGFAEVASLDGATLADRSGGEPDGLRTVLIGPEGGWDPAELEVPLPRVGLGDAVLRAETAALVAGTLMVALRSGTVRPKT